MLLGHCSVGSGHLDLDGKEDLRRIGLRYDDIRPNRHMFSLSRAYFALLSRKIVRLLGHLEAIQIGLLTFERLNCHLTRDGRKLLQEFA